MGAEGRFVSGAFDSLSAVELSNGLGTALGLELPGTLAFDFPSLVRTDSLLNAENGSARLVHHVHLGTLGSSICRGMERSNTRAPRCALFQARMLVARLQAAMAAHLHSLLAPKPTAAVAAVPQALPPAVVAAGFTAAQDTVIQVRCVAELISLVRPCSGGHHIS